jgi:hypothetical protein
VGGYRRRCPQALCCGSTIPPCEMGSIVIHDDVLICEHCDQPVARSLFDVTVAVWNRQSEGFFLPEPPPPAGVPLHSRQQLCETCWAKALAAVDGPWTVDHDAQDGVVAAVAATGA